MEPMLGTGRVAKESESSNEYFRLSLTNSWLFIALARREFVGGYVSALGVGAGCLYYDIILKTAKRSLSLGHGNSMSFAVLRVAYADIRFELLPDQGAEGAFNLRQVTFPLTTN